MDQINNLRGKLLIAMPDMGDPRFAGAVIYVCAHSDDGTMGLIVNRPKQDANFDQLLDQMDITRSPGCRDIRVQIGGPVERSRGFVLHSLDYRSDVATMDVADGIGMTATRDVLEALAQGGGPERSMLALGYAGWGPGQLTAELADNGWLTGRADPNILFGSDDGGKWAAALDVIGVSPSLLSTTGGRA